MTHAQALWLMVSIQLGVFSLGWAAVAAGGHRSSHALKRVALFNLALGAGLLLVALRGSLPSWLTGTPADCLVLGGCLSMWSALRHLHGLIEPLRWPVWGVAGACVVLLGLSLDPGLTALRVGFVLLLMSGMVAGMALDIVPRAKLVRGVWPRRALIGAALVLNVFMLVRAAGAVWLGWPAEVHLDGTGALVFAYVVVAALSMVNAVLAYLVLGQSISRLEALTRRDALTGLYNRRGFEEALAQAWERWTRERRPFAVLCIDLDHFKDINDRHGHAAGDAVLVRVSAVVSHELRKVDVLCRLGGDELVALLDGEEQQIDLAAAASRIGRAVRNMRLLPQLPTVRLTVSVGATPVDLRDASAESVLRRADDALYLAKTEGRDLCRVVGAGHEFSPSLARPDALPL